MGSGEIGKDKDAEKTRCCLWQYITSVVELKMALQVQDCWKETIICFTLHVFL